MVTLCLTQATDFWCYCSFSGTYFKPARLRNDKKLAFVPINLHIQRMRVIQGSEGGLLKNVFVLHSDSYQVTM